MDSQRNKKGQFINGMAPWNVGIPMSKDSKEKESRSKKGKPAKFINVSKTNKFKKILKNRVPTPKEKFLIELIKKYKLPFRYVGNGRYWVTGNKGDYGNDEIFNPDFISKDKKSIIEVYSRWHSTIKSNKIRDKRREIVYKKEGYKVIYFWEKELIEKNENKIIKKIRSIL